MTRAEALNLVREFVKNEGLVKHMLSVEAAMRFYAEKFGEDAETWGLIGLLHDFDWEIHPTVEQHPQDGAPILRERGVPEEVIQDILSHADHLRERVPRDTIRRKAICACDEITGLITAVALVRPSRSLYDLEPASVKKKWKFSMMKMENGACSRIIANAAFGLFCGASSPSAFMGIFFPLQLHPSVIDQWYTENFEVPLLSLDRYVSARIWSSFVSL